MRLPVIVKITEDFFIFKYLTKLMVKVIDHVEKISKSLASKEEDRFRKEDVNKILALVYFVWKFLKK